MVYHVCVTNARTWERVDEQNTIKNILEPADNVNHTKGREARAIPFVKQSQILLEPVKHQISEEQTPGRQERAKTLDEQIKIIPVIEQEMFDDKYVSQPRTVTKTPVFNEQMNNDHGNPPVIYPPEHLGILQFSDHVPPSPLYPPIVPQAYPGEPPIYRGLPQNPPLFPVAYPLNADTFQHDYNQPVYPKDGKDPHLRQNRDYEYQSTETEQYAYVRISTMSTQRPEAVMYENFENAWKKYVQEYRAFRGGNIDRKRHYGYPRDGPCDPVYSFCDQRKKAFYFKNFTSKSQKQAELGRILRQDYSTFFTGNRWFIKNTIKNIGDAFVKGIKSFTGKRK